MNVLRVCLFFGAAAIASATSVTFNFNGLAENASTTQIQNYMNGILTGAGCTGCTVTVSGAFADTTWNGDGHVTGPSTSSTTRATKSLTLGTSDGATASNQTSSINSGYDTFLATTNDAGTSTDSQITITFNGFTVNGAASFDYEIFPDATCTALTSTKCGGSASGGIYPNQPDFKFDINGNTPVTSFGTNGVQYGVTPGTTNGNTNNSILSSAETSPQYIGKWSGTLSNANSVNFIDWPATIGVDNLMISWTPPSGPTGPTVPEPVSVVLFGTVVAGLGLRKKFRKTA